MYTLDGASRHERRSTVKWRREYAGVHASVLATIHQSSSVDMQTSGRPTPRRTTMKSFTPGREERQGHTGRREMGRGDSHIGV